MAAANLPVPGGKTEESIRTMYAMFKKCLFALEPEQSHYIALRCLQIAYRTGLSKFLFKTIQQPREVMGLHFPNPIGLAAGLDKNGDYIDALAALGFGFIEIGTVTPKPQEGNPKPRLFRLTKQEAIINRMGFNNKGIQHLIQQLEKTQYRGILGINIGKNRDTPLEHAINDYLLGFRALWPFASYITINISSPNTTGLRDLQQGELFTDLLVTLKKEQRLVADTHKKYVPLVIKIAPDLTTDQVNELATALLQHNIDGVIATNTTIQRTGVENSVYAKEIGGLSGKPLCERSTQIIRELNTALRGNIPIIASGGIMDKSAAEAKLKAGATLLQIYTGFIYHGPTLIRDLGSLI